MRKFLIIAVLAIASVMTHAQPRAIGVRLGSFDGISNWGWVGGAVRAGIEYTFWFPLQVSLDYRPTVGAGLVERLDKNIMTGCYWDVLSLGLSARYRF